MRCIKRPSTSEDACKKPKLYIGVDTEAKAFTPEDANPPLACFTVFSPAHNLHAIYDRAQTPAAFEEVLDHCLATSTTLVANHLPFDIVEMMKEAPRLITKIFRLLDLGLCECTLLREKLDDIARARYEKKTKQRFRDIGEGNKLYTYSLDDSLLIRCGIVLEKRDQFTYRARFGEFVGLPISAFPQEAVDYALDDPKAHWLLAMQQEADEAKSPAAPGFYVYADAPAQTRMGVCLQLMRVRGINTDPLHTVRIKASLKQRANKVQDALIAEKFLRPGYWRPRAKTWEDPSKDTKVIKKKILEACRSLNQQVKMTLKDERNQAVWMQPEEVTPELEAKVCMDKDQLGQLEAAPVLHSLIEWNKVDKLLGYTEVLETGFNHPIHSEPNTLVENGRISWGSDSPDGADSAKTVNLTNLPTERGIRECYIPTYGNLFFSVDFSTIELCGVAQVCLWLFGKSRLAELINEGVDLHSLLGSMFLTEMGQPITYEEFRRRYKEGDEYIAHIRDAAKKANFGFWGGMGIDRFMTQHRELKLPRDKVVLLKKLWQEMLPETYDYFKLCGMIAETSGSIAQFVSQRIRSGIDFCAIANGFFSALTADGAKEACYCITRAMYAEPDSILYMVSWLVAFIHDEYLGEAREDLAAECVDEVARIAQWVMQQLLPDVKVRVSKSLMRRWRKGASAYYVCTQCHKGQDLPQEFKHTQCSCGGQGRMHPYEDSPTFQKLVAEGKAFL